MSDAERTKFPMIRSGIFAWKEILVRKIDSQYMDCSDGSIEMPLFVEDKGGRETFGIVKEFIYQKYRIGEMVAYKEPGTNKIHVGFSLVHPLDQNNYDKVLGIHLAAAVADRSWDVEMVVPNHARVGVALFIQRCIRYWKTEEVPKWATNLAAKYGEETVSN